MRKGRTRFPSLVFPALVLLICRQGTIRKAGVMENYQRKIAVNLLLKEGHQRCVNLDATDPSLISLLEVVAKKRDEKTQSTVFNLELADGAGSLVFAAADLVALSINPALSIDLQVEDPEIKFSRVVKENYLSKKDMANLLKFVAKHEGQFRPARVTTNISKARKSLVLFELEDFEEMFRERVRSDLPVVLKQLSIPPFPVSDIECQITAHNDKHHFQRHRDSGSHGTHRRLVTFVYYFYNEPRRFEGGSLRLFKGKLENDVYACGEFDGDFEPMNNSMIFFPSACFHEVLPIKCSSGKFRDSRFTVNGWVRTAG